MQTGPITQALLLYSLLAGNGAGSEPTPAVGDGNPLAVNAMPLARVEPPIKSASPVPLDKQFDVVFEQLSSGVFSERVVAGRKLKDIIIKNYPDGWQEFEKRLQQNDSNETASSQLTKDLRNLADSMKGDSQATAHSLQERKAAQDQPLESILKLGKIFESHAEELKDLNTSRQKSFEHVRSLEQDSGRANEMGNNWAVARSSPENLPAALRKEYLRAIEDEDKLIAKISQILGATGKQATSQWMLDPEKPLFQPLWVFEWPGGGSLALNAAGKFQVVHNENSLPENSLPELRNKYGCVLRQEPVERRIIIVTFAANGQVLDQKQIPGLPNRKSSDSGSSHGDKDVGTVASPEQMELQKSLKALVVGLESSSSRVSDESEQAIYNYLRKYGSAGYKAFQQVLKSTEEKEHFNLELEERLRFINSTVVKDKTLSLTSWAQIETLKIECLNSASPTADPLTLKELIWKWAEAKGVVIKFQDVRRDNGDFRNIAKERPETLNLSPTELAALERFRSAEKDLTDFFKSEVLPKLFSKFDEDARRRVYYCDSRLPYVSKGDSDLDIRTELGLKTRDVLSISPDGTVRGSVPVEIKTPGNEATPIINQYGVEFDSFPLRGEIIVSSHIGDGFKESLRIRTPYDR